VIDLYDILNAAEAAKVIGCGAQEVRWRIRRGQWKFGRAFSPKENHNTQWRYEINKKELADFLRIDLKEINERLNKGR